LLTVFILTITCGFLVSTTNSLFEAILLSISASLVELMSEKHPRQAHGIKKFKKNIEEPITVVLTLNTVVHTIGASVSGAYAVVLFSANGLVLISLTFTLTILLFTKIPPKPSARAFPATLLRISFHRYK